MPVSLRHCDRILKKESPCREEFLAVRAGSRYKLGLGKPLPASVTNPRAINSAARVPSSHGGSHWFESSIAQS